LVAALSLTLQALLDAQWRDVATLEFPEPELGAEGPCNFEYLHEHWTHWLTKDCPLARASETLPLIFGPTCLRRWPAFLDDIRPLGSARDWWMRRFTLSGRPADDVRLLRDCTVAPIGHLRIKESVPQKDSAPPLRFPRAAVIDRDHEFLSFAAERGAQVGGATGAGGDSPKVLLRVTADDEVWIDPWQDDPACTDRHILVKFARGNRSADDQDILRSEYVYYRALASLGIESIAVEGMKLEEGRHGPSLWLPRFDVARRAGLEDRRGLESMYSIVGARPADWLKHQDVLVALQKIIPPQRWRDTLLEYLKRDLLNLIFGNSDNHGRNTALLKTTAEIRLAPIYDFAPMKMDPEGVTRTTQWAHCESGGVVDWRKLLATFGDDEEYLRSGLEQLARSLRELPALLRSLGLPQRTLSFPTIGLERTAQKLVEWSLL
jgi:serine/threonine-protein kinase HipA